LNWRRSRCGSFRFDFLLDVMADEGHPIVRRVDAAKAAAPYLHFRNGMVDNGGRDVPMTVAVIRFPDVADELDRPPDPKSVIIEHVHRRHLAEREERLNWWRLRSAVHLETLIAAPPAGSSDPHLSAQKAARCREFVRDGLICRSSSPYMFCPG
jgi:hypothetical protein